MQIQFVNIRNFRGIREIELQDLEQLVVIAGQNGSGKNGAR
jgi:AAA15 family ATPase/GTPase